MGKVALITGASSGIGKELARIHASEGGDLILVARRKEKLEALKNELEQQYMVHVIVMAKDLTDPAVPGEIFKHITKHNIQVDYLINNAGFGGHGIFHERSLEKHLEMIQVNITALTALTHYFIPHMIANGRGRIMNVSSTAAFLPGPLQAVYYASKSYVKLLGEALHNELRDTNISVTTLCPGATSTEFASTGDLENTAVFQGKTRSASSVAEYGYRAMKKGKRVVINEPLLRFVLNYLLPLFPRSWVIRVSRMTMEQTGKDIKTARHVA
jgi:hypothetical protein